MEPVRINYLEALLYGALIGGAIGLILGLIPLILGIAKGKTKLGLLAIVSSIVSGLIWSLLPIVTIIVFIWLILRNPQSSTVPIDTQAPDSENN